MSELSKHRLERELNQLGVSQLFDLHVFTCLASTNAWLLSNLEYVSDVSSVCIANEQTAGSGRAGRSWYSPPGNNIYFSFSQTLEPSVRDFSALSLVMGLVVCRVLKGLGVRGVALKWPNDILRDGKKLAGILIEVKTISHQRYLVIGVGINVSMQEDTSALQEINCSDLTDSELCVRDREKIIALILAESRKSIDMFFESGFSAFIVEWNSCDAWKGELVQIMDQGEIILSGVESGVDERGCLQVQAGRLHKVSSGDVSLRKS